MEGCRLYRVAPHCSAAPSYLVLKAVQQPQLTALDPRGVFAAHCQDHLYLWQVKNSRLVWPKACCATAGISMAHQMIAVPILCGRRPSGVMSAWYELHAAAFCVVVGHSHICTHSTSFALTSFVCVYCTARAWFLVQSYADHVRDDNELHAALFAFRHAKSHLSPYA